MGDTCTVCSHATTMNWDFSCPLLTTLASTSWVTCVLFVATTMNSLQCTLFVATTTNWKYMCTVCHYYKLGVHVYCLWPLLQIGSTCVLFASTTNWEYMCTVCQYYKLGVHMYCLCPLLQIGSTCVLFVATTMNWEYMCTVCHY